MFKVLPPAHLFFCMSLITLNYFSVNRTQNFTSRLPVGSFSLDTNYWTIAMKHIFSYEAFSLTKSQ